MMMADVEDRASAISIDNDVDRFGSEQDVNIQLGLLALCSPKDVHSTLQDGELKPVANLKWQDASFTAKDCCTYTLTTKFQSDDVGNRFHGDFMQQLNHRKFARLRKLARILSDKGCLLLTVSLATDRVVLKVVHEKTVQGTQSRDARVAMVIKAMKRELIPRWSREGEEVELRFHSEDGRSYLDQKLSDLEEIHRNSVQRSEDQLRMIQQTVERFANMVREEGRKLEGVTLEQDLKHLSASTKPSDQRQQKTYDPNAQQSNLLSPGVPGKHGPKNSEESFSTKKLPFAQGSLVVNTVQFTDTDPNAVEYRDTEPDPEPITGMAADPNAVEYRDTEPEPEPITGMAADPAFFEELEGQLRKQRENAIREFDDNPRKILGPMLGKPVDSIEGLILEYPNTDDDYANPADSTLEAGHTANLSKMGIPEDKFTYYGINLKDDPFQKTQGPYDRAAGAAGTSADYSGGNGQKSATFQNPSHESGTGKKEGSSLSTHSGPTRGNYNDIPSDNKNQPPSMDQLQAAGTGSNTAQSHNLKNPPDGRSVNIDSPGAPYHAGDSNAQQRMNDPGMYGNTPGRHKNQPGQARLPASNARILAEQPRSQSHPSDGTHYQRQSRARMVERLEWASAMAAVEDTPSPRARRGMDTVLCLDNSLSMQENGAFQEMKKVALDFIEGLEEMAENSLEENVAVMSMGGGARVLQHLTNDYSLVRDAIESLEPQGWTPFFEALVVGMQCLNRRGKVIAMGRHHRIRARILCLTDGNPSDETSVPSVGQDPTMNDTNFRMMFVQLMPEMKRNTHDIYWVPVGQKANMTMLQILEKLKVGIVVEPKDRARLHRHFLIQNMLGHILHCKPKVMGSSGGKERQSEGTDNPDISEYEPFFMALASDVNEEDKEEVRRCLRAILSKPQETSPDVEEDEFSRAHVDPSKPPLGTRVVRGPDWMWGEQDGGMPGTVVKHRRRDGMVEVHWDHGGREVYRYEQGGSIDVMEAPAGTPPVFLDDRMICVGANVQRGPDWSSGDEDGGPGGMGVVIDCRDDGRVKVAWKNGVVSVYKFGKHNLYEVFVCDDAHVQQEFGLQASGNNMYDFQLPEGTSRAAQPRPVDGVTVWQWQDDQGQWRLYNQEDQDKLHKAFTRRATGSCLIIRGNQNYRVLFGENLERCTQDKSTRRVQKIVMSKAEYHKLSEIEMAATG